MQNHIFVLNFTWSPDFTLALSPSHCSCDVTMPIWKWQMTILYYFIPHWSDEVAMWNTSLLLHFALSLYFALALSLSTATFSLTLRNIISTWIVASFRMEASMNWQCKNYHQCWVVQFCVVRYFISHQVRLCLPWLTLIRLDIFQLK